MLSVAFGGMAHRIVARIVFKVLRAGSETAARYLSTSFEPSSLFADGPRLLEAAFFVAITVVPSVRLCGIPLIAKCAMSGARPVLRLRLGRARTPVAPLKSTTVRSLRTSLL